MPNKRIRKKHQIRFNFGSDNKFVVNESYSSYLRRAITRMAFKLNYRHKYRFWMHDRMIFIMNNPPKKKSSMFEKNIRRAFKYKNKNTKFARNQKMWDKIILDLSLSAFDAFNRAYEAGEVE